MIDDETTWSDRVPENVPFQFGLRHLMKFVFGFCLALGVCYGAGAMGGIVLLVGLALACVIWQRRWKTSLFLLIAAFLLGLMLLPPQVSQCGHHRASCGNKLREISRAIQWYDAKKGCLPPAYIADEHGKPMHSWRVLILPYIGQQALYDQYDFSEPWDGPNNRKLADKMPDFYRCTWHQEDTGKTSYLAVIGPGTAWDERRFSLEDIAGMDSVPKTILLVEVADSGIHWMEPRDLHIVQMKPAVNPRYGQGISSPHIRGANVAFADGHIQFLSNNVTPATLRALITANGGDSPGEY